MNGKKIIIVLLIIATLLLAAVIGMFWVGTHYVLINSELYSKDLTELDLRGESITPSDYERFQRKLPDCRILWNVPFQGGSQSCDITELTVTSLNQEDIRQMRYFPELTALHAQQCPDLDAVILAGETYPELKVFYQVTLAEQAYPQDTRSVQLGSIRQEDISQLPYLPELETVSLSGAEDMTAALALQEYCRNNGIAFTLILGDGTYDETIQQLTVRQITQDQISLLQLLPNLTTLHLEDPLAPVEALLALRESRSGLRVTWEKTIWGKTFQDTAEEVDLSDGTVGTLEEVKQGMTYLPNAKHLFLGFCKLDNEAIAAFREESRQKFKVVWIVDLSGKMQVRTDIDNFMPSRDGWGYVRDHEIDNIRYCEDLICMDIGHMGVKDVSFLETLVNLEYLILAHTEVQYVDPIVNCKKLKFLELDWSCIRDVSPLVELTALEDLNLGMTWPDITPILQMTWLKNLYLIKGNARANFPEHLPNTRVVTSGDYTVSNGWRRLPNYYAMRDILGMHYM